MRILTVPIAYLTYLFLFIPVVIRAFFRYKHGGDPNEFTLRLRDIVDDIITVLDGDTSFDIVSYERNREEE